MSVALRNVILIACKIILPAYNRKTYFEYHQYYQFVSNLDAFCVHSATFEWSIKKLSNFSNNQSKKIAMQSSFLPSFSVYRLMISCILEVEEMLKNLRFLVKSAKIDSNHSMHFEYNYSQAIIRLI